MGARRTARERQEELAAFFLEHPHEEITMAESADAVGRRPSGAFRRDLDVVRHWAQENDAQVTNCYWSPERQAQVMQYLPPNQEDGVAAKPLRVQAQQARTRMRNVGLQAGYLATYGVRPADRRYGQFNQRVAEHLAGLWAAFDDFTAGEAMRPSDSDRHDVSA